MRVLSTKSLDVTSLAHARSLNIEVDCVDFIKTTGVAFQIDTTDSEKYDALAFTSSNAVVCFIANASHRNILDGKKVYALSGKTKDALHRHNIPYHHAADHSEELADLIKEHKSVKSLLHICGNLALETLGRKMKESQIDYEKLIVYHTEMHPHERDVDHYDAILFFSPSGVESFTAKNKIDRNTVCCCIGETTAAAVRKRTDNAQIIVAEKPNAESMLNVLADYFKSKVRYE